MTLAQSEQSIPSSVSTHDNRVRSSSGPHHHALDVGQGEDIGVVVQARRRRTRNRSGGHLQSAVVLEGRLEADETSVVGTDARQDDGQSSWTSCSTLNAHPPSRTRDEKDVTTRRLPAYTANISISCPGSSS